MEEVKLAESTFLVLFRAQLLFNQVKIVCLWKARREASDDERTNDVKSIIHAIHSCYWLIEQKKAFIAVE